MFCQIYLITRAFYTRHIHDSPYSPFVRKKIEPIMFYEGINAKVFRRSIAFAITLVVTSRSSSFEYTMSVHVVHAGAERNVCNIVISTETLQTTTNSSQTMLAKGQIIEWMRKMTPLCTFVSITCIHLVSIYVFSKNQQY